MDGLSKRVNNGIYTPNEARSKEGLPKIDNGDTPMMQVQFQPLGTELNPKPEKPKEVKLMPKQIEKKLNIFSGDIQNG